MGGLWRAIAAKHDGLNTDTALNVTVLDFDHLNENVRGEQERMQFAAICAEHTGARGVVSDVSEIEEAQARSGTIVLDTGDDPLRNLSRIIGVCVAEGESSGSSAGVALSSGSLSMVFT